VAERMLQELIEAEATARIGAEWNEHTETRTALRNGHRDKTLSTQAGDLDLAIPKLRSGSFFPALLERRRRIDQALYAVIMEAYVHGVSTRSVDDLVKALGADTGISKSEVSRICQDLDGQLTAFRSRPLDHVRFPYVYLDATYCKARVEHQIVSRAVVIATGITEDGGREVLGNDGALLRLVTAVLFELHDEWIAFPRRYLPEGSMDQLYPAERPESAPALPNTTNTTAG
jgi:putative transposase